MGNKYYDPDFLRNKMSFNFEPHKKEEKKNFKIGDTVYAYDIFEDDFVKMAVISIHLSEYNHKEIMINGRFEINECFTTLKEAYDYECDKLIKEYQEDMAVLSSKYYSKEKELKQC